MLTRTIVIVRMGILRELSSVAPGDFFSFEPGNHFLIPISGNISPGWGIFLIDLLRSRFTDTGRSNLGNGEKCQPNRLPGTSLILEEEIFYAL